MAHRLNSIRREGLPVEQSMPPAHIEEYKELGANVRERHETIWRLRNLYTIIMLALVGFTYQLEVAPHARRPTVVMLALCVLTISFVVLIIVNRYSSVKGALLSRLVELEDEFGLSQYSRLKRLERPHGLLFGKGLYIIYGPS